MTRCALATALTLLTFHTVAAQKIAIVGDTKLPRFEVVSIKPGDPHATRTMVGIPPGRFVQENEDLRFAIQMAFGLGIIDAVKLLSTQPILRERYSIDARMPAGTTPADRALMLRAMFIDRFKLRYHVESSEDDAYALVVARRDGKLGAHLRESNVDCTSRLDARRNNHEVQPLPAGAKECEINTGQGSLDLGGVPIATLITMLGNQAGKPIIDKTGLTGSYDVELQWSSTALRATPAGPDVDGPSLFTAVQEQLGLKLEPAKTRVDHLVIDHIERPEPD